MQTWILGEDDLPRDVLDGTTLVLIGGVRRMISEAVAYRAGELLVQDEEGRYEVMTRDEFARRQQPQTVPAAPESERVPEPAATVAEDRSRPRFLRGRRSERELVNS